MNSYTKSEVETTTWEQGYLDWQETPIVEVYTPKDEIKRHLLDLGINEGKHVLVHSAYSTLAPVEGGPQTIVDALIETVGINGCVLFPNYNFTSWPHEHYYDGRETPSEMGIITEAARHDPRTIRTTHPIYSHAVYSHFKTPYFNNVTNATGGGSIFEEFHKNDGILLSIGWTYDKGGEYDPCVGFTIIHHYESLAYLGGAYWRRLKWFGGVYVHEDKTSTTESYSMTVRKPGVITQVSPAMEYLEMKGVVKRGKLGRAACQVANTREFGEGIIKIAKEKPELLRVIE
jgi:aminoglycoside 3-N-acetyltransferase